MVEDSGGGGQGSRSSNKLRMLMTKAIFDDWWTVGWPKNELLKAFGGVNRVRTLPCKC